MDAVINCELDLDASGDVPLASISLKQECKLLKTEPVEVEAKDTHVWIHLDLRELHLPFFSDDEKKKEDERKQKQKSSSINEKSDEEIVKENDETKEKKTKRNREYQRAWRQRKKDLKKKVSKEEKEEAKRKRHRENQKAYYYRKKGLMENEKNVEEFSQKKLDDLQMKTKKLDSNEDQHNFADFSDDEKKKEERRREKQKQKNKEYSKRYRDKKRTLKLKTGRSSRDVLDVHVQPVIITSQIAGPSTRGVPYVPPVISSSQIADLSSRCTVKSINTSYYNSIEDRLKKAFNIEVIKSEVESDTDVDVPLTDNVSKQECNALKTETVEHIEDAAKSHFVVVKCEYESDPEYDDELKKISLEQPSGVKTEPADSDVEEEAVKSHVGDVKCEYEPDSDYDDVLRKISLEQPRGEKTEPTERPV